MMGPKFNCSWKHNKFKTHELLLQLDYRGHFFMNMTPSCMNRIKMSLSIHIVSVEDRIWLTLLLLHFTSISELSSHVGAEDKHFQQSSSVDLDHSLGD